MGRRNMGHSGNRLWKWAVAAGVLGMLLMLGAVLIAGRWEDMFGAVVFLGLVCTWIAVLMLAAAWVWELWYHFRHKDYLALLLWLVLGLLSLIPFCRRVFF